MTKWTDTIHNKPWWVVLYHQPNGPSRTITNGLDIDSRNDLNARNEYWICEANESEWLFFLVINCSWQKYEPTKKMQSNPQKRHSPIIVGRWTENSMTATEIKNTKRELNKECLEWTLTSLKEHFTFKWKIALSIQQRGVATESRVPRVQWITILSCYRVKYINWSKLNYLLNISKFSFSYSPSEKCVYHVITFSIIVALVFGHTTITRVTF